jgi:phenylpyruvate tautomerase PptA (4-oxalocrotonate tautomerase family)
VPYLQLDLNGSYPTDLKRSLVRRMSETYASIMQVDIRRISIAIRELGEGNVWRTIEPQHDPEPAAVLMLDIRRGRTAELRMALAKALCQHCIDLLGLSADRLNVEFTQHAGDEMYHPALGGYSPEWSEGEGEAT